ncbi:MAG TPA: hypothetical protein VGO70_00235 [Arsenicitalea sp.]|jgi:pimeloyl-ACP methyl ester carboxylesterase|nr:hypothetical protein [Arsenicitalea sp.]
MRHGIHMWALTIVLLAAATGCSWAASPQWPLREARSALMRFSTAPFPYHGSMPDGETPFLDARDGERGGHTTGRAGVYWEDQTYSDNRTLIAFPKGFDARRPAVIVVYFHGNGAILSRDVADRQRVIDQVQASGLNAILVAPQFAVDALDSSAGRFWMPGAFAQYLSEAGANMAKLMDMSRDRARFDKLPVILVAYSGGYNPAAYALAVGGANNRIKGVVLLDAGFGEPDKFADWIERRRKSAFFFSAYLDDSEAGNEKIARLLARQGITTSAQLPDRFEPGSIAFFSVGDSANHNDFVTDAWVGNPLAWLLARVPGYLR